MDMKFYWVQHKICQVHYNVFWKPEETYFVDYFTKHYPPHHHHCMRPVYLHCPGNGNNSSERVCNYSKSASLKERTNQDSNREIHSQIRKMETNKQTDGQTNGCTDEWKELRTVKMSERGHQPANYQ